MSNSTLEPYTSFPHYGSLFLSSTWGRADQQTSQDSKLSLGRFVLRLKLRRS